MTSTHPNEEVKSVRQLLILSITALGVVFGDIGTSVLYAINEIFFGHTNLPIIRENILGCISLVIWVLTIVISIKYVVFVLRADNEGEGGVFALSSLISRIAEKSKSIKIVSTLLIFAAGLLFGDGIITPAISVISAIEGMKIVTPVLSPFVIPLTIGVLTGLFAIQAKGTAKVGMVFGPIVIIWFLAIGILGLSQIIKTPEVLLVVNPIYAISFLSKVDLSKIFLVLGSVMLVITGGEALYADMGHFGKEPIRLSWFSLVYPMLILNYLGQGAFLLGGGNIQNHNIFFSMVPGLLLIPIIVLATMATVIASQALISGAFSLVTQAVALGYFPRLKIIQTSKDQEGQRYIPFINWSMYVGAVALVLIFRSSSNLASVYGFAVAGDMTITSLALFLVAKYVWRWSLSKAVLVIVPFMLIDSAFFISNSLKILQGGFIPLTIGILLMIVMKSWNWGRNKIESAVDKYKTISVSELTKMKESSKTLVSRSLVIMTPRPVEKEDDKVPILEQMFIDRYGLLAKHIIFLTVIQHKEPFMHGERFHVTNFYDNQQKGSITSVKMNFGFMEEPNVEKYLEDLARHHKIHISEHSSEWLIHVLEDRIIFDDRISFLKRNVVKLFQIMDKNSISSIDYFHLGNRIRLSGEVLPVRITNK